MSQTFTINVLANKFFASSAFATSLSVKAGNGSGTGLRSDWVGQSIQLLHNVKMTYQTPSHEAEH